MPTIDNYLVSSVSGLFGRTNNNKPSVFMITEGKNLGKANATSAKEQAILEATSKYNHKIEREGYIEIDNSIGLTFEEFEAYVTTKVPKTKFSLTGIGKPMKCQPYYKENSKGEKVITIKFPALGQPKINGFRVNAFYKDTTVFTSKNGLYYTVLEHIEQFMNIHIYDNVELCKEFQHRFDWSIYDLIFDGEMYIDNTILSDISSAVRKRNANTSKLRYLIFDLAIENVTQIVRLEMLDFINNKLPEIILTNKAIEIVPSTPIYSDELAQTFCTACIEKGHEGAVFRDKKALYGFGKRPQTIVKLKRRESAEFIILDIIPMDKTPELGMMICQNDINFETFKVVPEGTHAVKAEYLKNKQNYIGKPFTVEFYERTVNGIPFHTVGIAIRDYE